MSFERSPEADVNASHLALGRAKFKGHFDACEFYDTRWSPVREYSRRNPPTHQSWKTPGHWAGSDTNRDE